MANQYYTKVGDYTPGTRARGTEIETEFDSIEDGFDRLPSEHSGAPTTKGFGESLEFEGAINPSGGLSGNMDGASTYKLTNMIDGTASQDYATIANVAAEVAGGGTPGSIPITSLDVGTATSDQFIKINSGGNAPVGITKTDVVEWYYPQGYFSGLELNSFDLADKRHDMRLEVGSCLDSDGDELLTVSSTIEKQFDAAWAEGDGVGGGAATLPLNSTGTYYFFLITKDADGTVDWMGDTSSSGANVPTGWTVRRQLGSWPIISQATGSMGWTDGGGRRQFGNRVMKAVNNRDVIILSDGTLTAADENFDLSSYIDSTEKSIAKLAFKLFSTSTTTAGRVSLDYHTNPASGVALSLQTGIVAAGDSDYAQIVEDLYNEGTTFYYVGSTTLTFHTLNISLVEYNNMREVNY